MPRSEFWGEFPEPCKQESCDGGEPESEPPAGLTLGRLTHELSSPACLTDRIFIHHEYPQDTGSEYLDALWGSQALKGFEAAKAKALGMSCNDFLSGCEGQCLPIGFEIRLYFQSSAPGFLSILEAERFTGNTRRGRTLNSTVRFRFSNYELATGRDLSPGELFPGKGFSPKPLWGAAEAILERREGACPLARLAVQGRPAGRDLKRGDFLLSPKGLTILLTPARANGKGCQATALDIPKETVLGLGADPRIFGGAPGGLPAADGGEGPDLAY
jgi:hypothetical protein